MPIADQPIHMRYMTKADIPLAMRLKNLAKWNQLEDDWKLLLSAGSGGNFVASYQGKDTGSTTTITYQNRFSWIGMVLVDPVYRGLGIGTYLLKTAIAFAQEIGTVRLDATPQGKKLYETLGFVPERELLRLERKAGNHVFNPPSQCTPVYSEMVDHLINYDAPIFGAKRENVINHLFQRNPEYAFFIKRKDNISGYCMGRSGSNFEQIGPVIADSTEEACNLLLNALAYCGNKSVIVDTFIKNKEWLDFLYKLGFQTQRPFTRMYLGELNHPGKPNLQYAIAGPELG